MPEDSPQPSPTTPAAPRSVKGPAAGPGLLPPPLAPAQGEAASDQAPPRRIPRHMRDAVTWAFRLFMGRDPKGPEELAAHLPLQSLDALRTEFIRTPEFQAFLETALPRARPRIGVPTSLLRPPLADIPWQFEPPTMDRPVSQLCTAAQFEEPVFEEILQAMGLQRRMHRRVWQHVYVISVLATLGWIGKGRSAIGLGVTRERIPALLASRGVEVMAMGRPGAVPPEEARGGYHLFFPEVVRLDDFDLLVHFAEADLKNPELDLGGPYDMCWSCAMAQHMGRMDRVLGLVEGSLNLLKPGGAAVHTMDFNIGSDADTVDGRELSIPRRRDIECLIARLVRAGHEVQEFQGQLL